jgi:hypothetical protein
MQLRSKNEFPQNYIQPSLLAYLHRKVAEIELQKAEIKHNIFLNLRTHVYLLFFGFSWLECNILQFLVVPDTFPFGLESHKELEGITTEAMPLSATPSPSSSSLGPAGTVTSRPVGTSLSHAWQETGCCSCLRIEIQGIERNSQSISLST